MSPFSVGQRWLSEAEPELGLGLIEAVERHRIKLRFAASDCERQYSAMAAPLKRVTFDVGDEIRTDIGQTLTVDAVNEQNGVLFYMAQGEVVPEMFLAHDLKIEAPLERLQAGMIDKARHYLARRTARRQALRWASSKARGFVGARIEPVAHQFAIASEVAGRRLPRVLLADEVGLGKTIEACLILHRLILDERVSRSLILVPDALVHQWFVELLRRFNLLVKIADDATFASPEGLDENSHFLCATSRLEDPKAAARLLSGNWDLVIADEAHQLTEDVPFAVMQEIAKTVDGLLLLSATPEQMGREQHFAQLRLLDPARYTGLAAFDAEASDHADIAALVSRVMEEDALSAEDRATLSKLLAQDVPETLEDDGREAILDALLDRHGPGRSIFRNTRAAIQGFPERHAHIHGLSEGGLSAKVAWLADFLGSHEEKVLLICEKKETAVRIQEELAALRNLDTALFHEDLNLLQRDRNAAWFAEEDGARLLISSEIGSEGRNFQFARHLVLFDLPLHPEKVEQRIGRLDRIGQKHDIEIHVPVEQDATEEAVALWYRDGVGIFSSCVPVLARVHETFGAMLDALVAIGSPEDIRALTERTRQFVQEETARQGEGRDRLLEISAMRRERALPVLSAIAEEDGEDVLQFVERVFPYHGFETEEVAPHVFRLDFKEGSDTATGLPLPPLRKNPIHFTCNREIALSREDLEFFTWDHPMIQAASEALLGSETGNTRLVMEKKRGPGLELTCVFVPECVAEKRLGAHRFLPDSEFTLTLDHTGKKVKTADPELPVSRMKKSWLSQNPEVGKRLLPELSKAALAKAEKAVSPMKEAALSKMEAELDAEIMRLVALSKVNPAIRKEEITALETEKAELKDALSNLRLRLDAVELRLLAG